MPGVRHIAPIAALMVLVLMSGGCGGGNGKLSSAQGTTAAPSSETRKSGEKSIESFGSEAGGSDREAILITFTDYLNAVSVGDYGAACAHLSAAVQRSLRQLAAEPLKAKGCTAILPKLLAPTAPRIAREQADGRIARVRIEGGRAFVVFHAPGAELYQLTMVRERGGWKAATVASSILVPALPAPGQ